MLKYLPTNIKNMTVSKILLENVGDKLPMHSHIEDTIHITIIMEGKVKISGPTFEKYFSKGEICDFEEHEYTHEIEALEDNSVFLNISKKYQSNEMTEEEIKIMEEKIKEFEKQQQEFRQMQLDMIKRIEEEDRAKGII
tara:strand:- start:102 stop:518 length:417 start_codon:yes stop_codon:yes gene_type:complete